MRSPLIHWLTACLLLVALPCEGGNAPAPHPQLEDGAKFQYRLDSEVGGIKKAVRHVRMSVVGRNNEGGIIIATNDVLPEKPDATYIEDVVHVLARDACVVDVIGGIVLRSGGECARELPERPWFISGTRFTGSCALAEPARETIDVPAGRFDAVKIECRREIVAALALSVSTYWYTPKLGAMVKITLREEDASRVTTLAAVAELEEYSASAPAATRPR